MKVVSFYTPDYKEVVKDLISSLTKFGIPYDIEELPSVGNWIKNTNQKPAYIKRKLLEHKTDIVWLDADSVVKEYPKLFYIIEEDFGAYFEHGEKLQSGTLFFKNNKNALKILDRWEGNTLGNSRLYDTIHLRNVIRGLYMEKHEIDLFFLPQSYCHIFDIMKNWGKSVIEQNQASRRFR